MAYIGYDTRLEWHSAELAALVAARVIAVGRRAKPLRALDLGCGHGSEALFLARLGWQVTALDTDRAAIRAARARLSGLEFRRLKHPPDFRRASAFTFRDATGSGTFDLVNERLLFCNLERGTHVTAGARRGVPAKNRKQLLWTAAYALAPGGTFVMRSGYADLSWGRTPGSPFTACRKFKPIPRSDGRG